MKAKEIIGEGLGSLVGKGLVKLGSKLAAKGAAKAAAPIADKAPGITRKVAGAMLRNPKKSIFGAATAYNLATDPEAGTWTPGGVGRAIGKTIGQAGDVVGGIWQGVSGGVPAAGPDAPGTTEPKQSSTKPASKEISYGEHPVPAPTPDEELAEPKNDNYSSGSYVRDVERRVRQNFEKGVQSYEPGAGQQNEAVKKKFAVTEADKVDFDKDLEQHFPDPHVRRAIASRLSRESGGRNVGELSYRNTSNKRIREKFPQLRRHSDSQLDALKQDDKQFFDTAYSKIGGYQYRGRGPIQITGRANYEKLDRDLGLKGALVKDPDLLLKDPAIAKAATLQYLKNAGLNKTFTSQKDAHQAVIAAVGGAAYAPGTRLGKSELAAVSGDTTVAGAPKGAGAKPSTTAEKPPPGQLIQMPDLSMGYKVGDKFVPKTTQGTGAPVDYKQAYSQATSSGGISRAEAMRQANAELASLRGAPREPSRPVAEPSSVVPKPPVAPDTAKTPDSKSAPAYAQAYPTKSVVPAQDTGSWDKFINTVTKGRVSPEEKGQVQVPESVNTEIQDILRLAGKR